MIKGCIYYSPKYNELGIWGDDIGWMEIGQIYIIPWKFKPKEWFYVGRFK